MLVNRKFAAVFIVVCALLFALARSGVLRYLSKASKPLGEAPRIEVLSTGISQSERQQFLEGDFAIVKDVKTLPHQVVEAFTEQGGSRLLIANPGQTFEATDFIRDSSVPHERLIIAGVLGDRCFVHYEQGGRGLSYVLEFFSLGSTGGMKMLWRGHCNAPVANLEGLQSKLSNGGCS